MAFSLSSETQQLIEARMKELGYDSTDKFLQAAVHTFSPAEVYDYDDLDDETKAAIEEGQAQIDRGLGRPWAEVDAELRARFVRGPKP